MKFTSSSIVYIALGAVLGILITKFTNCEALNTELPDHQSADTTIIERIVERDSLSPAPDTIIKEIVVEKTKWRNKYIRRVDSIPVPVLIKDTSVYNYVTTHAHDSGQVMILDSIAIQNNKIISHTQTATVDLLERVEYKVVVDTIVKEITKETRPERPPVMLENGSLGEGFNLGIGATYLNEDASVNLHVKIGKNVFAGGYSPFSKRPSITYVRYLFK